MCELRLEDVTRVYPGKRVARGERSKVVAVDGVSLTIRGDETVALVGESGCGKSTAARLLLGLEKPDSGRVVGNEQDGAIVRSVFQNPRSSLNPRRRIGSLVRESIGARRASMSRNEEDRVIVSALDEVGLGAQYSRSYPHALSGGQQQRAAIAAAIVAEPDFIVLDEPTSSLDVSIAAQVVNLLLELKRSRGCGYLFITHDLALARIIADRVAVMYLGRLVEVGPASDVLERPAHPYTKALIDAEPPAHPRHRKIGSMEEVEVPSPSSRPAGCAYHPRCPLADEGCMSVVPPLDEWSPEGRNVACYHPHVWNRDDQVSV